MRELIQLVLSALFGLLPLWLIIMRSRNRRRQRQAAAEAERTAPAGMPAGISEEQASSAPAEDVEQMLQTDSIWGGQYFTPPRPRVPVPLDEDDVSVWEQTEASEQQVAEPVEESLPDAPTDGSYSFNAEYRSADDGGSVADRFSSTDAQETDDVYGNSATNSRGWLKREAEAAITVSTLKKDELRRAVILSEILSAPRSLRPAGDDHR